MKNKQHLYMIALVVEIILTIAIFAIMIANEFHNVDQEINQYVSGLESDYHNLLDSYYNSFQFMKKEAEEQIQKDLTAEDMLIWLQSKEEKYASIIGRDTYDGFSFTYKGKYMRSWNYGDYTNFDANKRPWYITAQKAQGEIAIAAPYVTFLQDSEAGSSQNILLSVVQKYNEDISFCYDVKMEGINALLLDRYKRYTDTLVLMFDENGYILSSSNQNYYCHNMNITDEVISQEITDKIKQISKDKMSLIWLGGRGKIAYLTSDQEGIQYCLFISLFQIVCTALSNIVIVIILLVGIEVWIYWRMKKQYQLELELARTKFYAKSKQEFLSRMSHDIRTPLNAVIGFTAAEMNENASLEEIRNNIEKSNGAAKYLLSLINDVLDMSKIDSGQMEFFYQQESIDKMIEDVNNVVKPLADSKQIYYTVKMDCPFTYFICDKLHIQQILINLLNNAMKFTPNGKEVTLEISASQTQGEIAVVQYIIEDTGIGMEQEFLSKMFEPFTQEKDQVGGTGLGLAIVKRLVDGMKGSIHVESEKNVGTKFTVLLPFKLCEQMNQKEKENTLETKKVELEGKQVLVCEDHPLNKEIILKLLKKKKLLVDLAENGQIGVDKFAASEEYTYDFILMDLRMPILDGIGATKMIRALDREDAKTVPIIALTANAFDEDVKNCSDAGMNEHLSKPIDPQKLYETLEKYCYEMNNKKRTLEEQIMLQ